MDSRRVTVIDTEDPDDPTSVPVNNDKVSMALLNTYFPGIKGLKYYDKSDNVCGVIVENGFCVLDSTVNEYYAFFHKAKNTTPEETGIQKPEVMSLLSRLKARRAKQKENQSGNPISATQKLKRNQKTSDCQKRNQKTSDCLNKDEKKLKKMRSASKSLVFGWVHKGPDDLHFRQITKPFGGLVSIDLDIDNEFYCVNDIKEKVIAAFKNPKTEGFFNQLCSLEIGLHDGQIFKEFRTPDGLGCDLWEFLSSYGFTPKSHLYLVTKEKTSLFEHAEEEIPVKVNVEKTDSAHQDQSKLKEISRSTKAHSNVSEKILIINPSLPLVPKSSPEGNAKITKEQSQSFLDDDTDSMLFDERLSDDGTDALQSELLMNGIKKEDYPEINMLYRVVKKSEYTGSLSITYMSKTNIYYELKSTSALSMKLCDFDPCEHGFEIASISRGSEELLLIETDLDMKRIFSFPSLRSFNYHEKGYGVDELQGFVGNEFGVGCIPTCTDLCKATFTWYKNGEFFKKGQFLYWIFLREKAFMHCEVECEGKVYDSSNNTSQKVVPVEDQIINNALSHTEEKSNKSIIPSIEKHEFSLSNTILGAGAQATVKKGKYLGTDVAIKIINVINDAVMADLRDEMSVMEVVRHPNIIQIIGICCEKKKVYILMEFFESFSLHDLLFDEDMKDNYQLNVDKKNKVAKQICLALCYLHGQRVPIIHRDVKAANVMVNKHGIVKLGDLGMSKLCKPSAMMHSTTVRGTSLYMAPECYIDKQPASVGSDVWSFGCLLVEMYTENTFGSDENVKNDEDLRLLLKRGYQPNLDNVPLKLKEKVAKCFALNPTERPKVSEFLELFDEV